MPSSWMNDPKLKNLDPAKLQMLSSLASNGASQSPNSMLPFLMSAMQSAPGRGMDFSEAERSLLLEVLMGRLNPEEKKKAETIINMTSAFNKK